MAYFGGNGVKGRLHPSLQAYIDCFDSAPFPRVWPRGGGPHDQDPILMQHFRTIRDYEIKWKNAQREIEEHKSGSATPGPAGVGQLLDQFIDEMDLADDAVF